MGTIRHDLVAPGAEHLTGQLLQPGRPGPATGVPGNGSGDTVAGSAKRRLPAHFSPQKKRGTLR